MRYNENLNQFEGFHNIEPIPAIGETTSTSEMKGLVISKTVGVPEFQKILLEIEKQPLISRMIPGRISRQQKGSSELRFKVSYSTSSGIKCIMSKGATAQELFIVCNEKDTETITQYLQQHVV